MDFRWAVQHENVDVFDFELSAAELSRVERPSYLRTGLAWLRGRLGL
ncbi:MAG: hypothetical protein ABEJ04_04795 [Halobacteriaceae archaeon]